MRTPASVYREVDRSDSKYANRCRSLLGAWYLATLLLLGPGNGIAADLYVEAAASQPSVDTFQTADAASATPVDLAYTESSTPSIELAAAVEALPTGLAAGRTPGTFSVTNTGSAAYNIPILTPPGVGLVKLDLALVYNSRSGNGVMGQGWSMAGLSTVTRCNKTWAQDGIAYGVTNTASDRFCLDGQQLKLVSGTYGAPGSVYATEIESFSRIVATGTVGNGPASFIVTTKNGLVYEYGTSFDAKSFAGTTGTIRTWALSKIRDRLSPVPNQISVSYTNEAQNGTYTNGTFRVASIVYPTTATGQGPFYRVRFTYSARPATDILVGYLAGASVRELNRLDSITIEDYSTAAVIKSYNLTYSQSTISRRLQLTSIKECSASACLSPTTFTYQAGAAGWSSTLVNTTISVSSGAPTMPVDLNGDGKSDLLYPKLASSTTSRWWVSFATPTGYGSSIDTGITTNNSSRILIAPFTGIGRSQVMLLQAGVWQLITANGSSISI